MKTYGTSPTKFQARQASVIDSYRNLTGRHTIPLDRQYWTLCGPMTDKYGSLHRGSHTACELLHILDAGLVTPAQVVAVEERKAIAEANQKAIQATFPINGPKIHSGHLVNIMMRYSAAGLLKPALVNVDTTSYPPAGADLLTNVLDVLDPVPGPIMVVWNVIQRSNRRARRPLNASPEQVLDALYAIPLFEHLEPQWERSPTAFTYPGLDSVDMLTMIWQKRESSRKAA